MKIDSALAEDPLPHHPRERIKGEGSNQFSEEGRLTFSVLHVTEGISASLGGTAVAVGRLAGHLAACGVSTSLIGLSNGSSADPRVEIDAGVSVGEYRPFGPRRLGFSWELSRALALREPPDVIHIHGLWQLHHVQAARYARRRGIPIVVSPHGMLEPWALSRNRHVKRVARWWYQDRLLRSAHCLHTASPMEARHCRRAGIARPTAVIPLGVDPPLAPRGAWRAAASVPDTARVAAFLSRLHPKKGVDLLLRAWSQVQSQFPDWLVVVAGYDSDGYATDLVRLAGVLGVDRRTRFAGPVQGEEKEAFFHAADLFVLPSRSENFALVVGEALARGLPVITTTETPWSEIGARGCGWVTEAAVEPLARALQDAMSRAPAELREMGERGAAYVAAHFSPAAFGQAMIELYRWVLGAGPQPSFVIAEHTE